MRIFKKISVVLVVAFVLGFTGLVVAQAATTPSLGAATAFGILGGTYTNTVAGTTINGDAGWTTGPNVVPAGGPFTGAGALTATARTDASAALTNLNGQACTFSFAPGAIDLATDTTHGTLGVYTPGVYCTTDTGAASIGTAGITLSGSGTYIFRINGALTSVDNSNVTLADGASAGEVFWTPTAATTLGANTTFKGTIIDNANAITVGSNTTWIGRALALGAGVITTDTDTITAPATLRVTKTVVNGDSGIAVPSSFTTHVKLSGIDVAGSPAAGAASPGTAYSLAAGTYVVSEDAFAGYTTIFSGDCNSSGSVTLVAGDNKTCNIINTNVASLPASLSGAGNYWAPLPLINLTKIPNPLVLSEGPGSVTYTYTVKNVGEVVMGGVWVKDDKCSPVTFLSGDNNDDSLLDTNEEWIYRCDKIVSKTESNAATAHGSANGWDGYDIANATVVVGAPVTPPLIHLVKKPNVFNLSAGGGAVTYTYTVTNPGMVPLSNVSVTDDKCTSLPGRVIGHPGDLNDNNLLESNEAWSFTCQTNITQTTTNVGAAEGHANGLVAVDISPVTVVVAPPGLPDTGIAPNGGKNPWNIVILTGIFATLVFSYFARRKQTA